jgi:hypothetical protein
MVVAEVFSTYRSQLNSKGETKMSIDINKMQNFLSSVKSLQPKKWTSRKLWVMVAMVAGLIWLFKANLALILWQLTIIVGLWLVCTTVTDIFADNNRTKIKEKLIEDLSKDGLTKEEAEIIKNS